MVVGINLFLIYIIFYLISFKGTSAKQCHNQDAFTIKCYDIDTMNELTQQSKIEMDKEIYLKIKQHPRACPFIVKTFRLYAVPPEPPSEEQDIIRHGKLINSKELYTNKYALNAIGPNTFKIYPTFNGRIVANSVNCSFEVVYAKPLASIRGGTLKWYRSNTPTTIDASTSVNTNRQKNQQKDLQFKWTCYETLPQRTDFCTNKEMSKFEDKARLIIPAKFAQENYNFLIKVDVSIRNAPETISMANFQKIFFHKHPVTINIRCIKNCSPQMESTIISLPVIYQAYCVNCVIQSPGYIYWTIKNLITKKEFDNYGKLKNRKDHEFYLQPGSLMLNQYYVVTAEIKGSTTQYAAAEVYIVTSEPPALKQCRIVPASGGVAFETQFHINCLYVRPKNYDFEVYSEQNGKTMLLLTETRLEHKFFFLPPGRVNILINMTDKYGYVQQAKLNVQVNEGLKLAGKSTVEIEQELNKKRSKILALAKNGRPDYAFQGLSALVDEYTNSMPPLKRNLEQKLDEESVKTAKTIVIDSPRTARQRSRLLEKISRKYRNEPDPDLASEITNLCKLDDQVLSQQAQRLPNPKYRRERYRNNIKVMSSCSQACLNPNWKILKPYKNETLISITTEYPLIDELLDNREIYPDYTNDENTSEIFSKLKVAAKNMATMCFINSKIMIRTMVPEEDPYVTREGSMAVVSACKYHDDMSKTRITIDRIIMAPSRDFQHQHWVPVIDILMCITEKNPFWWAPSKVPLISSVVYIKFRKSDNTGTRHKKRSSNNDANNDIAEFKDPFQLTFALNSNASNSFNVNEANLPGKSISQLTEDEFYETVSTHRIFVFKEREFSVNFEKMDSNQIYDVVLTEFHKPTMAYFQTNYIKVSRNSSTIEIRKTQNYDQWWYLSVLPDKQMIGFGSKYYFSVLTTACYTFDDVDNMWKFACKATKDSSGNITCYCHAGTILTPLIIDNSATLENYLTIDFDLEIQSCWIIYWVTLLTFVTYSLALLYVSFMEEIDILDRVYFVADAPSTNRYAYLLIVTTGNKRGAGTTSNIIIQLYGTKSNSQKQVLNYPDPNMLMLKKNEETWFVTATEKSLGDLVKIEIWFDSIGNNTRWYCSNITIYDFQTDKSWSFLINDWLDLTLNEHYFFSVTPVKGEKEVLKEYSKKIQQIIAFHRNVLRKSEGYVGVWNLSKIHTFLTLNERITLIFWYLLVLYVTIMCFYNVPKFNESDSIDENEFRLTGKVIFIAVGGTLFSDIIQVPSVWWYGNYRKRKIKWRWVDTSRLFWIGSAVVGCACGTALVSCGLWVPYNTSLLWMVSVVIGILLKVILMENIDRIICSYLLPLETVGQSFKFLKHQILQYVELQRAWIYKRFGAYSLRPYFHHLYVTLDYFTRKIRKEYEISKKQTTDILEDIAMILAYVVLLYIVLVIGKDTTAVYSNREIKSLVSGDYIKESPSKRNLKDIEAYLENILIPSVQSYQWYGKFSYDNPGMMKDFSNKYLGVIRIRQHRTKITACQIPMVLNVTCRPDFRQVQETRDFYRGWQLLTISAVNIQERMGSIWKYATEKSTQTSAIYGVFGTYPGGGYVAYLGRTMKNSLINLEYIKRHRWLDLLTRAVIIEFLTYSPNTNLFNAVRVMIEISATGYIEYHYHIETRKLLTLESGIFPAKTILYGGFLLILCLLLVRTSYKLIRKPEMFFQDFWSVCDIIIVSLNLITIVFYLIAQKQLNEYISELSNAQNNEFVNYFHLFAADNMLTLLSAVLVFVATFRLWKLLRFMIIIKIAEKTIREAIKPVLAVIVCHLLVLLASAMLTNLLFNTESPDFRNIRKTFTTLIQITLGLKRFEGKALDTNEMPFVSMVFQGLFMLTSLLFATIYTVIITLYYGDAKDYYSKEKSVVLKYLNEKWVYYTSLMKIHMKNLRGGQDIPDHRIITPLLGDRYEKCLIIPNNRIEAMALITLCVLRNVQHSETLTLNDSNLISAMIRALYRKESQQKEIFFLTGNSQHMKLIDNRRVEKIAAICEDLVRESFSVKQDEVDNDHPVLVERLQRLHSIVENLNLLNNILKHIEINVK